MQEVRGKSVLEWDGMDRAFSYERVSSSQQVSGRGLGRQSDAAQRWADAHGVTLDTSLQLSDRGRSASKGHHLTKGALGRFLQLAQAGQLGTSPLLLVEAIDRLSRQEPLDAIETILTGLVGSGCRIITLEDGAEYSRATLRSDPTKLLVLVVKMQAAYEYSARLAMRMRDSWKGARIRLQSGVMARPRQFCPAWCSYTTEGGFVVDQAKAQVVREVFTLLRHQGAYATAKELNARGVLSPAGNPWTAASVRSLAINADAVYGAVRLHSARHHGTTDNEQIIEGMLPVILPKAEVLAVRELMAQRGKTSERTGPNGSMRWVGQGLTYCVCGARMGLTTGGTAPNRIKYLRCRHGVSNDQGCQRPMVVLADATAHLLRRLEPAALEGMVRSCQQSDGLDGQRLLLNAALAQHSDLERKFDNLKQSFIEQAEAGMAVQLLGQQLEERHAEVKAAARRVAGLRNQIKQAEAARSRLLDQEPFEAFRQAFAVGTDTKEQRQVVNRALKAMGLRIEVDGRRRQMGLQLGDGPTEWQTVRALDRRLLWSGRSLVELGGLVQESVMGGIATSAQPYQDAESR